MRNRESKRERKKERMKERGGEGRETTRTGNDLGEHEDEETEKSSTNNLASPLQKAGVQTLYECARPLHGTNANR